MYAQSKNDYPVKKELYVYTVIFIDRFFLTGITYHLAYVFFGSLIDNTKNTKRFVVLCDLTVAAAFSVYGVCTLFQFAQGASKQQRAVLEVDVQYLFQIL